jgi:hypothetical protein
MFLYPDFKRPLRVLIRDENKRHMAVAISRLVENPTVDVIPFLKMGIWNEGVDPASDKVDLDRDTQLSTMNTTVFKEVFGQCRAKGRLVGDKVEYESLKPVSKHPDARFMYFVIGPCYFGRPGTYHNYYLGFNLVDFTPLSEERTRCQTFDEVWAKFKKLPDLFKDCTNAGKAAPVLALTFLDQERPGDETLAGKILQWMYWGDIN